MTKEQENLLNAVGRSQAWANAAIRQIDAGAMKTNERRVEWRRLLFLAAETLAEIKNEIQEGKSK